VPQASCLGQLGTIAGVFGVVAPHCPEGVGDSFQTSFTAPAGRKFTNLTVVCSPPAGAPQCAFNPLYEVLATGPRSAIVIGKSSTTDLTYEFSADLVSDAFNPELARGEFENGQPFVVDFGAIAAENRILTIRSGQRGVRLTVADLRDKRLPDWLRLSGDSSPELGQTAFTLETTDPGCSLP
jgi:hypothetical protein